MNICRSINPKSGSKPHFGVDIPFIDCEVRALHGGLEADLDEVGNITGWCLETSPLPRTIVASPSGAIIWMRP